MSLSALPLSCPVKTHPAMLSRGRKPGYRAALNLPLMSKPWLSGAWLGVVPLRRSFRDTSNRNLDDHAAALNLPSLSEAWLSRGPWLEPRL